MLGVDPLGGQYAVVQVKDMFALPWFIGNWS